MLIVTQDNAVVLSKFNESLLQSSLAIKVS